EDGEVDGLAGFISKPPHGGHRLSAEVELRQGRAGQSERGAAQTVFGASVGCQVTEPHQVGDEPVGRAWGQARGTTYLAQVRSGNGPRRSRIYEGPSEPAGKILTSRRPCSNTVINSVGVSAPGM